MEVHFPPEVETQLLQVASANGKNAEQLVQDTVTRMLANQARFIVGVQRGIQQAEAFSKPIGASLWSTKTWLAVSTGYFTRDTNSVGGARVMHVTIDLSEQNASALEAQARAAHMLPERYLNKIVTRALHSVQPAEQPLKPKKSAYGLLAQYGPGPTEEEIDENRREMFRGFGELAP